MVDRIDHERPVRCGTIDRMTAAQAYQNLRTNTEYFLKYYPLALYAHTDNHLPDQANRVAYFIIKRGHMGARRHTEVGLKVVKVDAGRNLLFVRGAVPGPMRGILEVRKQGKRSRYA